MYAPYIYIYICVLPVAQRLPLGVGWYGSKFGGSKPCLFFSFSRFPKRRGSLGGQKSWKSNDAEQKRSMQPQNQRRCTKTHVKSDSFQRTPSYSINDKYKYPRRHENHRRKPSSTHTKKIPFPYHPPIPQEEAGAGNMLLRDGESPRGTTRIYNPFISHISTSGPSHTFL